MFQRDSFIDCFFRLRRRWEVDVERRGYIAYAMEVVARRIGGSFYEGWRRVVADYAEFWHGCMYEVRDVGYCVVCRERRWCWGYLKDVREILIDVCSLGYGLI